MKLAFWPLNTMQFKAMLNTQKIAPKLKALQQRYKNDREKLNAETMALYKETGANPLAGCAPILLQMPILISLYWAVISDKALFASQTWLWIGSSAAASAPYHVLAANLAMPDYALLVAYIVSMYFSVRFTSPAVDPQQAQQQKIMAFISPAMVGYLGLQICVAVRAHHLLAVVQRLYDGAAAVPDPQVPYESGGGRPASRGRRDERRRRAPRERGRGRGGAVRRASNPAGTAVRAPRASAGARGASAFPNLEESHDTMDDENTARGRDSRAMRATAAATGTGGAPVASAGRRRARAVAAVRRAAISTPARAATAARADARSPSPFARRANCSSKSS